MKDSYLMHFQTWEKYGIRGLAKFYVNTCEIIRTINYGADFSFTSEPFLTCPSNKYF